MNTAFLRSYQCLLEVYANGAFSGITLNKTLNGAKAKDVALITKLVYGVLDEDIRLTYVISKFVKKLPKTDVLLFLKIGTYCLQRLSIPRYAVVNDIAELAKLTGDKRTVGFVNATLKSIADNVATFDDWPTDETEKLSVQYSYPLWALKKLIKDYGKDVATSIVTYVPGNYTTVRITNGVRPSNATDTVFDDAFCVTGRVPQENGTLTVQSLSSMAVSRVACVNAGDNVLDCCSAPGGKAVYLKQLSPTSKVTACDVYEHRCELIRSYAKRMNVDVNVVCKDMTENVPQWNGKFDTVLCDVPCSGFGVLDNRPDIKLFRQNQDISELMKLQYAILDNCCNYVKVGGKLVYSTCTVFDNENGQNIRKFLNNHGNFTYGTISLPQFAEANGKPYYQFLPHKDGVQGFFVAVLTRVE